MMSREYDKGRRKILKANGIGLYEIRGIYDDLGLTGFFDGTSFGHIIPVTYKLTDKGLEQSVDKSRLVITNLSEGKEPFFKFRYENENEKVDFIGHLTVKK
jgi:hypothetical protein